MRLFGLKAYKGFTALWACIDEDSKVPNLDIE
jgi:hypothetical protein